MSSTVEARRKSKTPESGVLRACLDLLAAEKIWHRRWNTGAVKVGGRFFRFGNKGDADILAIVKIQAVHESVFCTFPNLPKWFREILRPVPLWVETKSSIGKQTVEQLVFQREAESEGHYYLIVRDVEDLRRWLREYGVIRK